MLKTFRLKNFKAHQNTLLEMARLTVFIGPQGSGKSTIAHALQLLKNSSGKEELSFTGSFAGLSFADIVHQRNERFPLSFSLDLKCAGAPAFMSETGEYTVTYDVTFHSGGLSEHSAVYEFGPTRWEFRTPRIGSRPGKWSVPEDFSIQGRPPVKFSGSTYALLPFRYRIDEQDYALHRGINDLRLAISDFFTRVQVVPENRLVTSNAYSMVDVPEGAPQTIEQVVSMAAREWDVRDEISDYFKQVLERRINFRAVGNGVSVEVADGLGAPYPVMCEGGGLRALVWPMAAIASAQPGDLLFVEEPEIHLHPVALGRVAQLLISVTKEKNVQMALTSHSEHLLLPLLSAVGNGDLPWEDIRIYFCKEEAGHVVATKLDIDASGRIEGGLPGFFEASLEELGAFVSGLKRNNG